MSTTGPDTDRGTLRAFRHRDFSVLWLGAVVSNTGSWFQNLAVPYVVYELTGSAVWVGLATAAQFLPAVVASPLGGHLADVRERRSLLLVQTGFMAVCALALWGVWSTRLRSPGAVLALAAAVGLGWGLQMPAWQAFVNDLVPREDLVSAVSLNSLQFNVARAVGPALAGVVIATAGPGAAFALNAASFLAVMAALLAVRSRSVVSPVHQPLVAGLVRAARYVPTQPGIAAVLATVAVISLVAGPVFGFTVVMARSVFGVGPLELGILNAALGAGAVVAVPAVVRAKARGGLARSLRAGVLALAVGFALFAVAPGFAAGALAVLPLGFGFLLSITAGHTALQLIVAAPLRGRVIALRLMVYVVCTTVGALVQGWLADRVGPRATLLASAAALLVFGICLLLPPGARLLARVDDAQDDGPVVLTD